MGQAHSPPKSCAKPSSTLFQNSLAQKIKDSAFKKHLSSHGFVRKSNLRSIVDSKASKSSNSEKSQSVNSNLKESKQNDSKKRKQNNSQYFFVSQNYQNLHLSDIEESQAQYEDEQIKKNNKTSNKSQSSKKRNKSDEINQSQKSSSKKKFDELSQTQQLIKKSIRKKSETLDHDFVKQPEQNKKILIPNETNVKNSDIEQSNLVLFTQSKKMSSHKSAEILSKHKTQQDEEFSPSKLGKSREITDSIKKTSDNLAFDQKKSTQSKSKILFIKPRKSQEFMQQKSNGENKLTNSFDKTLINSKTGFSKQDVSLAINMKRLAQTAEVKQQNLNKNHEESLRHSIKKVYVSQLDESEVSGPQSTMQQGQTKDIENVINRLINSKSFQSDLRNSDQDKSSFSSRKSYSQKIRQSISIGRARNKLMQTMHSIKFEKPQRSYSQLSLTSRLKSKMRAKINESLSQKSISERVKSIKQHLLSQTANQQRNNESKVQQIVINIKNTEQNYFNQNNDKEDLMETKLFKKRTEKQIQLKNQIVSKMMKPSQYQVQSVKKQTKQLNKCSPQCLVSQQKKQNLNTGEKKQKKQQLKNTRKLYVFADELTYSYKENLNDRAKHYALIKQDEKQYQTVQQSQFQKIKIDEAHDKTGKSTQKKEYNQVSKQKSKKKEKQYKQGQLINKQRLPINVKENYLKNDIERNHVFVQYHNKKNPEPSDKRQLKILKFSQLEPSPFQFMAQQKMIKTTSAKNYPYNEDQSKIQSREKPVDSNIQLIDKIINNFPTQPKKTTDKRQHQRNQDYNIFIQQLQQLKKVKEIEQKLIQENLSNLKKSSQSITNKISILDLNKSLINEQITTKIDRMNKLKELTKLTKKMDPALMTKSRSAELLREEYQKNLKKKRQKQTEQKKYQNSLEKDLYYNLSKELNNLSNFRDSKDYINNTKMVQSSRDFTSPNQYMVSTSHLQRAKPLKDSNKLFKRSSATDLTCIPESPQMKFSCKNRDSLIFEHSDFKKQVMSKIRQTPSKLEQSKRQSHLSNFNSKSSSRTKILDPKTTSSQKTITKKTLIVF